MRDFLDFDLIIEKKLDMSVESLLSLLPERRDRSCHRIVRQYIPKDETGYMIDYTKDTKDGDGQVVVSLEIYTTTYGIHRGFGLRSVIQWLSVEHGSVYTLKYKTLDQKLPEIVEDYFYDRDIENELVFTCDLRFQFLILARVFKRLDPMFCQFIEEFNENIDPQLRNEYITAFNTEVRSGIIELFGEEIIIK